MLDYVVLFNETAALRRARNRNRFVDPLEAAEWRGLEWSLRLFGYGERAPEQAASNAKPSRISPVEPHLRTPAMAR